MEHGDLDAKIAELAGTVKGSLFDVAPRDGQFWRGVWGQIRTVGQDFRTARYPSRADKDAAWAKYQGIVDEVKQQQAEHLRNRKNRDEES